MNLIPQFSIRHLLFLMIGLGAVFFCFSAAARGSLWAYGLSVAFCSIIVPMIVLSLGYWFFFLIARVFESLGLVKKNKASGLVDVPQSLSAVMSSQANQGSDSEQTV